jgi:hypothetical protein
LEHEILELNAVLNPCKDYFNRKVPMLENRLNFYQKSNGKMKKKILSCIFSDRIYFDENKAATISFQKPIENLLNAPESPRAGDPLIKFLENKKSLAFL